MTVYAGADCATSFQDVAALWQTAFGHLPSWVGRYVGNYAMTAAEASWLHANNQRILPCWNNATAADVPGSQTSGSDHGNRAVRAAQALGISKGVAIPLDIEQPWYPSASFIEGYAGAVKGAGYVPAVYLNVLQASHIGPWRQAQQQLGSPIYLWSSEPEYDSWAGVIRSDWTDFSPWLGADAKSVCWHQYHINDLANRVDLDVATAQGYGLLWAPAAPPAPPLAGRILHVVTALALKTEPNHTSQAAIDPHHQHVKLSVGMTVKATGKTHTEASETWYEVQVLASPVRGWFLESALRA